MTRLTPLFSSNRMVTEYVEGHYLPAAARVARLSGVHATDAIEAAARRGRVEASWSTLAFGAPAVRGRGSNTRAVVPIDLGALGPADVALQFHREPSGDSTASQAGTRNSAA